ncbi:uncharacterized protein J3R85_000213 [Psidium guajava]|nr:uncharacterized protein J3R85_000213 [Psidium guajava]
MHLSLLVRDSPPSSSACQLASTLRSSCQTQLATQLAFPSRCATRLSPVSAHYTTRLSLASARYAIRLPCSPPPLLSSALACHLTLSLTLARKRHPIQGITDAIFCALLMAS